MKKREKEQKSSTEMGGKQLRPLCWLVSNCLTAPKATWKGQYLIYNKKTTKDKSHTSQTHNFTKIICDSYFKLSFQNPFPLSSWMQNYLLLFTRIPPRPPLTSSCKFCSFNIKHPGSKVRGCHKLGTKQIFVRIMKTMASTFERDRFNKKFLTN